MDIINRLLTEGIKMISITEMKQEINTYMNWEQDNKKINSFLKVFNIDLKELYRMIYKQLENYLYVEYSPDTLEIDYKQWHITLMKDRYNKHQYDDYEYVTLRIIKKFVKQIIHLINGMELFIYV